MTLTENICSSHSFLINALGNSKLLHVYITLVTTHLYRLCLIAVSFLCRKHEEVEHGCSCNYYVDCKCIHANEDDKRYKRYKRHKNQ